MSTHHPTTEKLNLLGAAMITATAAHGLFCLATLPGLINTPTLGFIATAVKLAGVTWSLAGIAAAGYAAFQSAAVLNGRSLAAARKAAVATLILPLIGLTGGVTAFALLPIGAVAFFLFRSADWQSAFADHAVLEAAAEPIELNYLHEERQDLAA
jgi:hypothetical protein